MALAYRLRIRDFGIYNCGAGILANIKWFDSNGAESYGCPSEYRLEHKEEIIKDFLSYLNDPTGEFVESQFQQKKKLPGVIAHYKGPSNYVQIPFWFFHDNVKAERPNKEDPFSDLSSVMNYLYHNQKKYGCTVVRTHMADNKYHNPAGSHPGRCYILTPPGFAVFDGKHKLTEDIKGNLKKCIESFSKTMDPEDVATLKSLL